MKHVLIVGRAGVGKTSMLQRLAQALHGRAVDGFVTEEFREGGERLGFWLSSLDGRQVLLAHRWHAGRSQREDTAAPTGPGAQRVGPYRVNVGVIDQVAVEILDRARRDASIVLIDEINRLLLSSEAFRLALEQMLNTGPRLVLTAGVHHVPWLDSLKHRGDIELVPLSSSNRDAVREELILRLRAICEEHGPARSLHQQADRICQMIASREIPEIDIEIHQARLRDEMARHFPDHQTLYQAVYEPRFRRVWQQFRHSGP